MEASQNANGRATAARPRARRGRRRRRAQPDPHRDPADVAVAGHQLRGPGQRTASSPSARWRAGSARGRRARRRSTARGTVGGRGLAGDGAAAGHHGECLSCSGKEADVAASITSHTRHRRVRDAPCRDARVPSDRARRSRCGRRRTRSRACAASRWARRISASRIRRLLGPASSGASDGHRPRRGRPRRSAANDEVRAMAHVDAGRPPRSSTAASRPGHARSPSTTGPAQLTLAATGPRRCRRRAPGAGSAMLRPCTPVTGRSAAVPVRQTAPAVGVEPAS